MLSKFPIQKIKSLFLLMALSLNFSSSFAVEKSEEKIEQETIKAKASVWREAKSAAENPSELALKASFPDKAWWEQFQDPYLFRYI